MGAELELFTRALGLSEPWQVVSVEFDEAERRLELRLDFPRGARFPCPKSGEPSPVHDSAERRWRHLDFFQHQAYLIAPVPRVRCPDGRVLTVEVPWARPGSGFTLLFEALVMTLAAEMPVRAMAKLVGEHDTRLWRVVHHYVDEARGRLDLSALRRVGIDETSFRRGQDYITPFCDLDRRRVVFATPGRDKETVARFAADLTAHGGDPERVREVCQDMSEAYLAGVAAHLPKAQVTFDRFHLAKLLGEAVDEVRRTERKEQAELLRGSRYLWLRRPETLSARQRVRLDALLAEPLRTVRAYRWRLAFDRIFELPAQAAPAALERWRRGAMRSRLEPIKRFARTIAERRDGVLRWWTSQISNGLLEGLHSLVQAAKRRARGYRSTENYIAMIYLVAGKLELPSIHTR
jgi:transposase